MTKAWESDFPDLKPTDWAETSPATRAYNCFAWAAGDTSRRWEPDPWMQWYWPASVPRRYSLDAFVKAYESIGYTSCSDVSLEAGFQKIALYADIAGFPTHAALQLPDGQWSSKLGHAEDITHRTLACLSRSPYGQPVRFLKKKV